MRPRMRPSSTRKLIPSSAMVVPKALRRPRASMHAIASALLLLSVRRIVRTSAGRCRAFCVCTGQQLLGREAETLDGGGDPGPLFRQKLPALALQQKVASAGPDEHAETPSLLDQFLIDE